MAEPDISTTTTPWGRITTGGQPDEVPKESSLKLTAVPAQHERDDNEVSRIYGLGGYSQSNRVLLCMVGLPARGKSYITKMLMRFLSWSGFPVEAFNAGNVRRGEGKAGASASFFKDEDKEASALRERIASVCLDQAIQWLQKHNCVCIAVFDATNTTIKRRKVIIDKCKQSRGITPVFIESICDNPEILERNYGMKLQNNDYKHMDPAQARADFMERVKAYEKRYETITDEESEGEIIYIKLFNVGRKVIMHHCTGYLMSNLGFFLANIHITPRSIWLTQHAECEDQLTGVLGGISKQLTRRGRRYCRRLAAYVRRCRREMLARGEKEGAEMLVLMGTAPVHYATLHAMSMKEDTEESPASMWQGDDASPLSLMSGSPSDAEGAGSEDEESSGFSAMSTSLLNELDGGDLNGMSYEQIKRDHPEIWAARERDKLNFRYPGAGGESYADVIGRLRPIIIELERQRRSILIISHKAVQRCLYAYFTGCSMEDLPNLEMDMHTVIELRPGPFGCAQTKVPLEAAVNMEGMASP